MRWPLRIIYILFLSFSMLFLVRVDANAIEPELLLSEVNTIRLEQGLSPLTYNNKLTTSAGTKIADIQKYHYWSHTNPETKVAWWQPIWNTGYRGKAGENLARGFATEKGIVQGWLKSPTHKANLLNANYHSYGIAVGNVDYEKGTQEVTVFHFGI